MSQEITITVSLGYTKGNITPKSLTVTQQKFDITGSNFHAQTQIVPTTAGGTAMPLGSLTTLGWYMLKNNDPTNYVDILTAVSGTVFERVPPLGVKLGYFPPGITAPAAIAHTASVQLESLILEV